jgi:hypothetical protein
MSAEAPPATGIEPIHVDVPAAASQEPDNLMNELRVAFNTLRRRRRQ